MSDSLFVCLKPEVKLSFEEQLDDLLGQLQKYIQEEDKKTLVFVRVFLSDIQNQYGVLVLHSLYKNYVSRCASSIIEQPPVDGAKIYLLVQFAADVLEIMHEDNATIISTRTLGLHIFQSVRLHDDEVEGLSVSDQTALAFERHIQFLRNHGLTLADNCVRTWLYVRDVDHNYHDVVVARNQVFAERGLSSDTHFIASTGIGGMGFGRNVAICIDFYSVDKRGMDLKYLRAPEYLNDTIEYGVSFERATQLLLSARFRRIYVSGTASIDKYGKCLYRGDVIAQLTRLMTNIEALLRDGSVGREAVEVMIVYLRDIADYKNVDSWLQQHMKRIPYVIVEGRVCRSEWLIEIECVANE